MENKTCPICKNKFEPAENAPYQTYCSKKCEAWACRHLDKTQMLALRKPVDSFCCEHCGTFVQTVQGDHRFKYCSRNCRENAKIARKKKGYGTGWRIVQMPLKYRVG